MSPSLPEHDHHPTAPPSPSPPPPSLHSIFTLSTLHKNILKCAVAYFLASLFTFVPQLSGLISDVTSRGSEKLPSPSGHMVATIAVYYNPAKTVGGMLQADMFCLLALFFAAFVSLGSVSMYWLLAVHRGWEWLADLTVFLWIAVAITAVAWMKVWMNKPSFNTACSMTSIIMFIVVVKEGGMYTLDQVILIVFIGSMISNATCFILWPQTATKNLQDNMSKTLDSFCTLLETLVASFLLEEPLHHLNQENLQKAVENHQASFISLRNNLEEARSEMMISGNERLTVKPVGAAYEDCVDCMTRMAQHLNGLRSGSRLQYDLAKAHRDGKIVVKQLSGKTMMDASGKGKAVDVDGACLRESEEMLRAAANMFGDLVEELGPPLKSLSNTCTSSLKRLKEGFVTAQKTGGKETMEGKEFERLMLDIERALHIFESMSNHAIMRLYRKQEITSVASGENSMLTAGSEHENVFLVYYFIFTLQEFASELVALVDAMGRICACKRAASINGNVFSRFFSVFTGFGRSSEKDRPRLSRSISMYLQNRPRRKVHFPKIKPHAPNTMQTPDASEMSMWGRINQWVWRVGARIKEPDMKYAVKVGMATAMLAMLAFLESTRPVFMEYRGEWALISFFVVMSPTIGATNFLSVHRILGTFLGAATATAIWSLFPENPIVLSIFGFFFSIPCFYWIVKVPKYATSARFVLLTYNLTCLYSYNIRLKEVPVVEIALHRSASVTVGVVWAGIVSRYWWPAEARRELGRVLSEFCLNMGWLYTRLVAFNSNSSAEEAGNELLTPTSTESSALLGPVGSRSDVQEFMSMELHLQIKLIELQGLLAQTQHEPRLKGPFPVKLYRSILTSLQSILDKLHSMRCVSSREEWHTSVRRDFMMPVNKERREMVGNTILYFSVLSSAFRLKAPLPPYLPPAAESQRRLVDAIRQLDVVKNRDVRGSRQLLFFAYAITMKAVIGELDYLGKTLQDAFGVIGQSREEFDELFRVSSKGAELV